MIYYNCEMNGVECDEREWFMNGYYNNNCDCVFNMCIKIKSTDDDDPGIQNMVGNLCLSTFCDKWCNETSDISVLGFDICDAELCKDKNKTDCLLALRWSVSGMAYVMCGIDGRNDNHSSVYLKRIKTSDACDPGNIHGYNNGLYLNIICNNDNYDKNSLLLATLNMITQQIRLCNLSNNNNDLDNSLLIDAFDMQYIKIYELKTSSFETLGVNYFGLNMGASDPNIVLTWNNDLFLFKLCVIGKMYVINNTDNCDAIVY